MKPLLLYDGDCGFCRRWVARWIGATGEAVEYAPYQEAAGRFPEIPITEFKQAVQLLEPEGGVYRGAEAVFRLLARSGAKRWPFWCYRQVPGFAAISERAYRFVADHRKGFSKLDRWWYGDARRARSQFLSRWLFLRLLGVIYLITFASLWVQIGGLVGSRGILPAADYLAAVRHSLGEDAVWQLPTIAFFDASDRALGAYCLAGMAASVLLIFRIAPAFMLFVLWALYLSLCGACQIFTNYQWDILLLETGFLAIFLAPWKLWPRLDREPPPSGAVLWLLRWLLFRLMFASGAVKLLSADPVWWDLSALTVHYETQPLPTWIGWYAHQLPLWVQQGCCAIMFVIELGVPFLAFLSGRWRVPAFFALVLLQVLIALTGNYTFFNLLTVALCVLLLDDGLLRRFFPRFLTRRLDSTGPRRMRPAVQTLFVAALLAATLPASLLLSYVDLNRRADRQREPNFADQLIADFFSPLLPFRSIGAYGLFGDMTTERHEIVLEGSADGRTWRAYDFKWKPGDASRRPGFVAPHQPRLDWQMWFAALGDGRSRPVVLNLMGRVLEGSPEVLGLLETNPFSAESPRFVRAVVYSYRFTDLETLAAMGHWWEREPLGLYERVMGRP